MNLQVCVPYEKCPFNCPMCIAVGRKVFKNEYKNNKINYLKCLSETLEDFEINDVVLTGNTDPTLNTYWLKDVANYIKEKNKNINIELQTKNYNLKGYNLKSLDTLAYSITDVKSYLKSWNFRKIKGNNRLVILLTKEFSFLSKDNFNPMGFNQITFKVLQKGEDKKINEWIMKNKMNNYKKIYDIVDEFNGTNVSIRIDTNCQDSTNRYKIFREDSFVYNDWSE